MYRLVSRRAGRLLSGSASRALMVLALPAALWPAAAFAQDATLLPPVDVSSPEAEISVDSGYVSLTETGVSALDLLKKRVRSNDTATLLDDIAGVNAYSAGGVSSLPVVNGLADDRIRIVVDGMVMSSACPNHMNSPLSYIDPSNVASAKVLAGITPVSMGGDSIAGTIVIDSGRPLFGTSESVSVLSASASTFYRSNGDGLSGSLSATAGNDKVSIGYTGSGSRSGNYDGGGNDGEVHSTEYKSYNQALKLAARGGDNLVTLEVGQQYIPYEGYPNQYMDMTDNRSTFVNGSYEGAFAWGKLEARAYWQGVEHEMNFLADKGGTAGGGMPMNTQSDNAGYAVKASFALKDGGAIRIGNEFHLERLDDWWPPVAGSMMMSPDTYININGGKRDRLGTFAEWDAKWTESWSSLLGIRNDTVWTDTGNVQSYGCGMMMCGADDMAAAAFNAAGHRRSFVNFDLTAIAKYEPNATSAFEFGYARKSRAPNLYELYAWGRGAMSSSMIGWFGDGNGYVGNLNLDSEVANTVSATADFHSADRGWELKVTPYYTRVNDFIGVQKIATLGSFAQLQFVNQQAELYGANLSGKLGLWKSDKAGEGTLRATLAYVRGRDLTTGGDLYHIMPLNAALTLEEAYQNWAGHVQLQGVARKSAVDDLRSEPTTPAYALVNLGGSYSWANVRLDLGVDNLFDKAYDAPLGGQSLGDQSATGVLRPVPGLGRSLNLGLTLSL